MRYGWICCLGPNAHQSGICQKRVRSVPGWSRNRCAGVWGSRAPVDAWQDVENVVHHAPRAKAVDCNRHSSEAERTQRILTLKSVTFSFSPSCPNFTLAPLSLCVSAQQGVRPEWCGLQEGVWGGAAWMLAAVQTGVSLTWSLMCSTVAEVQAGLWATWTQQGIINNIFVQLSLSFWVRNKYSSLTKILPAADWALCGVLMQLQLLAVKLNAKRRWCFQNCQWVP